MANIVIGLALDSFGAESLALIGLTLLVLNYLGAFLCRPLLPGKLTVEDRKPKEAKGKLAGAYLVPMIALFVVNFLLWASHTPLYLYLSVYLQDMGWTGSMISLAWNLGVIFEIGLFAMFSILEKRVALTTILRSAIVFTVVRWAIMATQTSVSAILFAQLLHLFSFGACYLCLLYTSPSPRDATLSRMPSSA